MKNLLVAAIILTSTATSALSAPVKVGKCGPRDGLVKVLEKVKEEQLSIALTKSGPMMELWGNRKKGSYTLFMTAPNMMACVVSTGEALEIVQPKKIHY